jgi:uncharacterized protein (DUF58 family)
MWRRAAAPEAGAVEPGVAHAAVATLRQEAAGLSQVLPALMVEADRVAATVAQGVHGRRRTGVGETFWQFRPYQAGDDATDIDWRQSARSRQLFIREQEWEAAESVWLWADLSPSMAYRSGNPLPTKRDRALLLLLALAELLVRGGERVALLGAGERPRGGRHGLNLLATCLGAAEPGPLPPEAPLPRFARLVLISDFLQPLPALEQRLARYRAVGGRGCLMQVADPAEELLPWEGRVLFEGLEQEGQQLIRNVGAVRAEYQARFAAHRATLADTAVRTGWSFAAHRTDGSAQTGLLTLFQMLAPGAVG